MQTTITHGLNSDYFVFGWVRGSNGNAGEILMPAMSGGGYGGYVVAYNEVGPGAFGFQAWDWLTSVNSPGDRHNITLDGGDVRFGVFERQATFDSGWSPCGINTTYNFQHNIGRYPHYVHVEVAENSDGSGWRVPMMGSSNYTGATFGWRQVSMVGLSTSNVTLRTQTSLGWFYRNGTSMAPTSGHCRVRAFDWTPEYDSGWVAISTSAGQRDKVFDHKLGQLPSLVNVYVAQNNDGSGWAVMGMGTYHQDFTSGVGIYHVGPKYAVIKGGASNVARFVDRAGQGQGPTSGFVRFMAWR